MKPLKAGKVIELCIWTGVLLVLTGMIVHFARGGGWDFNIEINGKHIGNLKEAKREEMDMKAIEAVEMQLVDADVEIAFGEENKIQVVESTNDKKQKNLFEMKQQGNTIIVERQPESGFKIFGGNRGYHLVQVKLPKSFKEKLEVNNSSGDIKIQDLVQLKNLVLTTSSGDITLAKVEAESTLDATSGSITVESIKGNTHCITTSSGDITLEEGQGNFEISSTSGDKSIGHITGSKHKITASSGETNIDELEGACQLSGDSGDIIIQKVKGDADIETTSGSIYISKMQGKYVISGSSGDITLNEVKGCGKAEATAGEVYIGEIELEGDVDVATSSGDVTVGINQNTGANVEMETSSGDIEGDAKINFENKNGNKATAQIGKSQKYHVTLQTTSGEICLNEQ